MRNKGCVLKKICCAALLTLISVCGFLWSVKTASALSQPVLSTVAQSLGQQTLALSDGVDYEKYSQNSIIFYKNCDPDASWGRSVTTNPKPSGNQITWIGDSYTQGAESIIKDKLSGVDLIFQVSKAFKGKDPSNPSGLSILKDKKDELREYVVFALGTNDGMNGGVTKSDIEKAVSLVNGKKIIFVTAYTANGNNYDSFNEALKQVGSEHPGQVYVADWAAVAKPEYYEQDSAKIHPTGHFQEWFDVIYDALPGGSSSTVGGVTTTTYKGHTIAFPLAGASKDNISGGRGEYTYLSNIPCNNSGGCHYGPSNDPAFDICFLDGEKCKNDATVVAMTDGEIIKVTYERTSQGSSGVTGPCNGVRIRTDIDNTVMAYYHMEFDDSIKVNTRVKAGDVIGKISNDSYCHDDSTSHVHIDKGMDPSAPSGPSASERDPELVEMINAAYAALPESGTSGSTNVNSSNTTSKAPSLSPTSDSPENNAAVVWNTIVKAGIDGLSNNPAAIAGVVGNFMEESAGGTFNLDPFICQHNMSPDNPAAGAGIFQATEGRKVAMKEYMAAHGAPWKEGCSMSGANASQNEIIKAVEAETEYAMTEQQFKDYVDNINLPTNKTPEGYSDLFLVIFEGANRGDSAIEDPAVGTYLIGGQSASSYLWSSAGKRRDNSKRAYEAFSDGSYVYSSSSEVDPCEKPDANSSDCTGGLPEGGMNLEQAKNFMKTYADEAKKGTTGTVVLEGVSVTDSGCTGASGDGIGGALNNCSAFSAWFVNRYTSVNDFPVTQGSQTVNSLVSNKGFVNLGNKPKVYSIMSSGPMSGSANGWANHTGVVLGIDEANDKIIIGEASCSVGYYTDRSGSQWPGAHEYSLSEYSSGGTYAPVYASTEGFLKNECGGGHVDISQLTLEEKVAQLFVTFLNEFDDFKNKTGTAPGGVIFLYDSDFPGDRASMKAKIGNLQSQAKEKLFITVDEEGGTVARLAKAGLCSNMGSASSLTSKKAANSAGSEVGKCLKGLGFNVDFAPVADTLYATGSSVLKDRVFANSSDPKEVATLANAFREGLDSQGVIATYKHFPGHGSAAGDTHTGKVVASKSWSDFKKEDIIPFKDGIDKGVDMIMVAHITTNDSDGAPVSMSSKYLQTYLREELGYKGIIITDALVMDAADKYSSNPALSAFEAGADILLQAPDPVSSYNSVLNAVKSGDISEERLNESVQRILDVKAGL